MWYGKVVRKDGSSFTATLKSEEEDFAEVDAVVPISSVPEEKQYLIEVGATFKLFTVDSHAQIEFDETKEFDCPSIGDTFNLF